MRYLSKEIIFSPLGNLTAVASEQGLCRLDFEENGALLSTPLLKSPLPFKFTNDFQKTLEQTKRWLNDYFEGRYSKLQLPAIDLQGTFFYMAAWKALIKVPIGKTKSYGELAKAAGFPKAARAIGRAMGQNPIAIIVPCHRIIGTNGNLTGYSSGIKRKEWLLKHEGHSLE